MQEANYSTRSRVKKIEEGRRYYLSLSREGQEMAMLLAWLFTSEEVV